MRAVLIRILACAFTVRRPPISATLGQSLVHQLDYLGLLHPNAEGHRVYRDAILRKLQAISTEGR
jgi:hypothetical protein